MAFKDLFVPYPDTPAEVAKAIVYMFLGGAGALVPALADNNITAIELVQTAIIVIGLIPVYVLGSNAAKTASVAIITGLQVVANLLAQFNGWADIPASAWLTVIITAFAGIGVAVTPNKSMGEVQPVKVVGEPLLTAEVGSSPDLDVDQIAAAISTHLKNDDLR